MENIFFFETELKDYKKYFQKGNKKNSGPISKKKLKRVSEDVKLSKSAKP